MYEFLLIVGVIFWLVVGTYYIRHPAASMFHPATYYLLEHFLLFVVRPIFGYFYDYRGIYVLYQFMPSIETKSVVLASADLGMLAFVFMSLRYGAEPFVVRPQEDRRQFSSIFSGFLITALVCLPLALYSLRTTFNNKASGLDTMILDTVHGVIVNTENSGYISDAWQMLQPLTALFAWLTGFKWWSFVPFLAYFAVGASTGQRGPVVIGAVVLCILYLYRVRRRWLTPALIVGLTLVVVTFRVAGDDRGASIRAVLTGEKIAKTDVYSGAPLENMDFANMEFFEYLVHTVPQKTGTYDYFVDNLQILTEPVPRVLWPGKPSGPPIQRYLLWDYGTPIGITFSMPGEGWLQLGWLGVALWCGLFGWFYGYVYSAFVKSRQTYFQVAFYMAFMPQCILVIRDGVLITMIKASLFILLPVALWWLISRTLFGVYAPRLESPRIS